METEQLFKLETGHRAELVFTSGDIDYYTLKDISNTFSQRALEAMAVYDELAMRCDANYLRGYVHAMKENMKSQLNIPEIYRLTNEIEERLNFIVPTADLIWKLAAIAYFDKSESPYGYDAEYAKVKIEKWKSDKTLNTVFFLKCMPNLMPSFDTSKIDLATYLKVQSLVADKHLEHILSAPSLKELRNDIYTALSYQKNLIQTLPIAQS